MQKPCPSLNCGINLPIKFSFTGPFSLSRRIRDDAYSEPGDLVRALARRLNAEAHELAKAGAGLLHGYAEQRALSVHIKRYERMHFLFAAALRVLDDPMTREDWTRARDVLAEVGRESLEENADWVMLHRERPIELPGA